MQDLRTSDLSLRYNSIEFLEQQRNALESRTLYHDLSAVSAIFLKHKANLQFGIALLHRHHDLPQGHAMVHSYDSHMEDTCRVAALDVREIYPSAYHLHNEEFIPYEFSYSPTPTPASAFLAELAIFLKSRSLHRVLALCNTSPLEPCWMETLSPDGEGTVAKRIPQQLEETSPGYIITEWGVLETSGGCQIRALKGCETLITGVHKRRLK